MHLSEKVEAVGADGRKRRISRFQEIAENLVEDIKNASLKDRVAIIEKLQKMGVFEWMRHLAQPPRTRRKVKRSRSSIASHGARSTGKGCGQKTRRSRSPDSGSSANGIRSQSHEAIGRDKSQCKKQTHYSTPFAIAEKNGAPQLETYSQPCGGPILIAREKPPSPVIVLEIPSQRLSKTILNMPRGRIA